MNDAKRQTGRTTRMLKRVIEHVRSGGENACAVIVAASHYHADDIKSMLTNLLLDDAFHVLRGIKFVTIYDKYLTVYPGGIDVAGESRSNIFVDHYAIEMLKQVCAGKRDDFRARAAEEDLKIEWLHRFECAEKQKGKADGKAD